MGDEKRYGGSTERDLHYPADPGMTMAEILETWDETEITGQLAREVVSLTQRVTELEEENAELRRNNASGFADVIQRCEQIAERVRGENARNRELEAFERKVREKLESWVADHQRAPTGYHSWIQEIHALLPPSKETL